VQSPLAGGGDEEEIIGDTLWNATFYTTVNGHPKPNYMVTLDTTGHHLGAHAGDSMFVRAGSHHWGWYTSHEPDCGAGSTLPEVHDLNGDTIPDGYPSGYPREVHCLPAGEYAITLWQVTWNALGTQIASKTAVADRKVALLDTLGSVDSVPGSHGYYDVHVAFDLGFAPAVSFSGDIRAGTQWVYPMESAGQLYGTTRTFQINPGSPLWFISTFVPVMGDTGGPPQAPPPPGAPPWYGSQLYTLTGFKFDYAGYPNVASGAINSVPKGMVSPLRHYFLGAYGYAVVGNPTAPDGSSADQDTIWVATGPLTACLSTSGALRPDSLITFNAGCSVGAGPLEYRWTFGDGSPVVDWSVNNVVVHHAYASPGQYGATLQVRLQGTYAEDDTTTTLVIAAPLTAVIRGVNEIHTSGTYTWSAMVSGGASPFHYQWYYRQPPQSEHSVGTDSYRYSQYVNASSPYYFILRVVVTDASQQSAQATCTVEVGLYGPQPKYIPPACN
jgi:PKD domain